MMEVFDEAGEWLLCRFDDGSLAAARPEPFDGARYLSTEARSVAPGKASEYQSITSS